MEMQFNFNRREVYTISVCASSKLMKQTVTHKEENVKFVGYEGTKLNLLTFKRNNPKDGVQEHLHIKREYILGVENY